MDKQTPIPPNRQLELSFLPLKDWRPEEILQVIKTQYDDSSQDTIQKKLLWLNLIKLYLNQYKKLIADDIYLGSNLIFNQFQETFSAVDSDNRRTVFEARSPADLKKMKYTNAVANFDFEEMRMGKITRSLLWDTLFFGIGLLDVSLYDKKRKLLILKPVNPMLFFVDKQATSIEDARYAGRFIYKTPYELKQDPRLDESKVMELIRKKTGAVSYEKQQLVDTAKRVLIGNLNYQEPIHPQAYIEILEWYMYSGGDLWVVWTDNSASILLGYQKVDYRDAGNGSKVPFVPFYYIKTNLSFWGIGLPEKLEDLHRADVVLKNYLFQGVKLDATPTFLYNIEAIINPRHLSTKEIGKSIPVKGYPVNQVVPFPKTNVVSNDTLAFMSQIQSEALGMAGYARLAGASLAKTTKKTATEYALRKAKEDILMSSLMRNIIEGEKDFWYRWLKRHERFMDKDDTKFIELTGFQGAKEFLEVKKSDFIPEVDPKITVVSSLEAEPERIIKRRDLGEILSILPQIGGNVREAVRYMLYLTDLMPDQIDGILPPTPHEIKAEKENEILKQNKIVEIDGEDDDNQHIAVHMRIQSTEARELHIAAHMANILRKQGEARLAKMMKPKVGRPPKEEASLEGIPSEVLGEERPPADMLEARMPTQTSQDIIKQVLKSPQEGTETMGKGIIP
jgi:hypothetical protein